MRKLFLRLGSILGLLAVVLGAFGSHSLKEVIQPEHLNTFEIGIRYQFMHAIVLLVIGTLFYERQTNLMAYAAYLFMGGIILFSGSLYLIALQEIFNPPLNLLGPITPFGGLLLISGWLLFFLSTYQTNQRVFAKKSED